MTYTLEHLKIVHNAGAKKISLDKTLELISLLERNGLLHLASDSKPSTKRKGRRKRNSIPKSAKVRSKLGKRRGNLSEKIISFLSAKGETGAHVKEIVKAIKAPLASVRVWFYTSGKKYIKSKEIKKVAPATFAYFKPDKTA